MGVFLLQVFSLLTTDVGSLTYHLVLAFSIAGALQASFLHWRSNEFPQGRRMVWGLSLLLVLRLALFASAGLVWQSLVNAQAILPLLDRAATLLSLITILWLWIFPEPVRLADAITMLLGLLTIALMALALVWRLEQKPDLLLNGSIIDKVELIYSATLTGIGWFLLLIRRPNGWGAGVAMLTLLICGSITQWLVNQSGNYPGAVRLFQMAAYPLLLILPQRFPASAFESAIWASTKNAAASDQARVLQPDEQNVQSENLPGGSNLNTWLSFLALATSDISSETAYQGLAATIARLMGADLCLLISPPGPNGTLQVWGAFDLVRNQDIPGCVLNGRELPMLVSRLQRGRPLRLPESATSTDLKALERYLNLERSGPLLLTSVLAPDGMPSLGVVLLSPYSRRTWSKSDESNLLNLSRPMAQFLQRLLRVAGLLVERDQALQAARAQELQARNERQVFTEQLTNLQRKADEQRQQTVALAMMVNKQDELQEEVMRLRVENEALAHVAQPSVGRSAGRPDPLTGEPRQALPIGDIADIAQELRKPLASLSGYTDFLLSESVGILGALQRKFLLRIQAATGRMRGLLDDLQKIVEPEHPLSSSDTAEVIDLNAVIQDVVAWVRPKLVEKRIILRLDLPEQSPQLVTNRGALTQILFDLIDNASTVTPPQCQVELRAELEQVDGKPNYVHIQVVDQGGGLNPQGMPRLFSRLYRVENAQFVEGEDHEAGLVGIKALVESMAGRFWVDSRPGQGATFSLLLPAAASVSPNGRHGETAL